MCIEDSRLDNRPDESAQEHRRFIMAECTLVLDNEDKIMRCVRKKKNMAEYLRLEPEDILTYLITVRIPKEVRAKIIDKIEEVGLTLEWMADDGKVSQE